MTETRFRVICNNCDVATRTGRRNDGTLRVRCPVCGADFGTDEEVQARIPAKIHEAFRDRLSWRAVEA